MKTKNVIIFVGLLGLSMLVLSALLGGAIEEPLAIHWNAAGEADNYGTSFMGLYFLPLMAIGVSALLLFIPAIDPLKRNISDFRNEYNLFIVMFVGFFFYLHLLTLAWNLGYVFSMTTFMVPALGLFFIFTGRMVGKAKRNYFIGIRTPWTLANDEVWDKTHQLGAKLFYVSGGLTIASILFPSITVWVLLTTAIAASVISIAYSYIVFRQIEERIKD